MAAAVDWERESYPAYGDFLALPFFVVLFPAARFLLDRLVFERVARRLILGKGHRKVDYEIEETRMKIRKFKESAWKCIYFLSGELLSLSVTYNEPWFTNTKYFWVGPGEQVWPDQKIKFKLKAVYMFSAGFYTYSIFALIFWETRRSDFGVSMSHHVTTVVVIVLSYIFRFARVGSIVLAIHDASDVFLEIGKMSKYSHCEWLANVAFLLFAALWVVLRLTYFPLWILRSTSYEVLLTLDKKKHSFDGPIYYYVFNSLLFSLLVLHIYWWVLICRMLVRQIKSRNVGDDVRSADDPHSSAPRMGSGSQSGPAEASSAASHGATLPFFGSLQRLHRRESKRSRGPRVAGRPNNDLCLARWGCNRSCGGVAARRHSRLGDARSQGRAARRGFYQPANSKTL